MLDTAPFMPVERFVILAVCGLFSLTTSCYPPECENLEVSYPAPSVDRVEIYNNERQSLELEPTSEWGIALSGGGIRSALFSIGTLKGFYDSANGKRIMTDVGYISSVSGGGYASYWLYNNEIKSDQPFWDTSLGDGYGEKVRSVTDERGSCRMYPSYRMLYQLFTSRTTTNDDYASQINKYFGNGNSDSHSVTFGELAEFVKAKNAPVPIVNATISAKSKNPSTYRNFEITPNHMGNPEVGADTQNVKDFSFNEAVSISGMAFGRLQYEYVAKSPASGTKMSWVLSDGGHNENLGVLPLVRRGVKNIVVIDGEHSPNYKFDAVKQLRNNLSYIGCSFTCDGIEKIMKRKSYSDRFQPIESGVFQGKITGPGIETIKVWYVKMSYNQELRNSVEAALGSPHRRGGEKLVLCDWLGNEKDSWSQEYIKYNKLGNSASCMKLVRSYSRFLNQDSTFRRTSKLGGAVYNFPHMSTVDQSYRYADQVGATIALGYLQGQQLASSLNEKLQSR